MFPVDRQTLPALLAVLLVLQDEVTAEVLHAPPLLADGVVHHLEGLVVAQVEVVTVPSSGEETTRSCKEKQETIERELRMMELK